MGVLDILDFRCSSHYFVPLAFKGVVEIYLLPTVFVYISVVKHGKLRTHSTEKLLIITRNLFEDSFIMFQCRVQTILFDENR